MNPKILLSHSVWNVGEELSPEGRLSLENLQSASSSGGQIRERSTSGSFEDGPHLELTVESFVKNPLPHSKKVYLAPVEVEGIWVKRFVRIRSNLKPTETFKNLYVKILKGSITVQEFLYFDSLIPQFWLGLESQRVGNKEILVSVLYDLMKINHFHKMVRWDKVLDPYHPDALTRKTLQNQGFEVKSKLEIIELIIKLFKLPKDYKRLELKFMMGSENFPKHPPKAYIGKGYNDHGGGGEPHNTHDRIQNGESSSNNFDVEYLRILKHLKSL